MQLLLHLLAFFDDVGVSVIINCPLGGLTFIPREREELGVDKVEVITFIVTLFPFLFSVQLSFFFIHERFAIAQNTDEYLAVFS